MLKDFFKKNLIYINSGLIFLLILFCLITYLSDSIEDNNKSIDKNPIDNIFSGYSLEILQNDIYKNIDRASTYVVGITSSKNVKFYMEDPSLLQWPGTAIEKNSKLDEASGILLWKKGYVLTNKHVVENADAKYSVILQDGSIYDVINIWYDKQLDLAILKTNISDKDIQRKNIYIPQFYDFNEDIMIGKFVLAVWKKWDNDNMIGFGMISSKNKKLMINNENLYANLYQINALLEPWFSGSPLLDMDGKILSMNTAVDQNDWKSFSLPISNQLINSTLWSIDRNWKITRWLVWIKYDEISESNELQKKYNLTGWILVKDVLVDLPAFVGWLQVNDIILTINNDSINRNSPFLFHIYNYLPGEKLNLGVLRQNSLIELSIVLGENM